MKTSTAIWLIIVLIASCMLSNVAHAQSITCLKPGVVVVQDTARIDCGTAPAPTPPPVPTPPPIPSTGCDMSQLSFDGLARQCDGSTYWPTKAVNNYHGPFTDLFTVLRGTWSNHAGYGGQPYTFNVSTGQYVALAFVATDVTHGITFEYNQTSGQNGKMVWVSTTPGGPPISTPYGTCAATSSANLLVYPFPGYGCSITKGATYWVNWTPSDGDARPISFMAY